MNLDSYKPNQFVPYSPLVSVIVPNYNYSHYLRQRIDSILSQTYDNFEIIILDDKSTDDSVEVIKTYDNNPRISKILLNEKNSGSPFIQWNRGIREAKGEIIWIAESDDYCTPDFLGKLVPLFVANNSVLTFCHSELVDEKGKKIRDNHQMINVNSDFSMDGKEFIKKRLAFSNEVQNASCAIFSKDIAMTIDNKYMDFKGAGDWLFWIEIAEKGNVSFVCDTCNSYRLHNNTTSKVVKSGLEFHEMKDIYEWLLNKDYIDYNQYLQCRYNNILLIKSLNEISREVKSQLYDMWEVSSSEKMKFHMSAIKSAIFSRIKCLLLKRI